MQWGHTGQWRVLAQDYWLGTGILVGYEADVPYEGPAPADSPVPRRAITPCAPYCMLFGNGYLERSVRNVTWSM